MPFNAFRGNDMGGRGLHGFSYPLVSLLKNSREVIPKGKKSAPWIAPRGVKKNHRRQR